MTEITRPTSPSQFADLLSTIQLVDQQVASQASRAVNISLTVRNWLIGLYIHHYEQEGEDRARYGDKLLNQLAKELTKAGVSRSEARELRRYRLFYQTYPQIWESLTPEFHKLLPEKELRKWPTPSPISEPIRDSPTPISGGDIFTRLSFTHIAELLRTDTPEKRDFYTAQCISGDWTVESWAHAKATRREVQADLQKLTFSSFAA